MSAGTNLFILKRRIRQLDILIRRTILAEVFLLALWPSGAVAAMLVGTVCWMLRLRIDPKFHFRHLPFDAPIAVFVLLSAVSIVVSPDIGFSFYNYYNLVGTYVLTYLLIGQNIRNRRQVGEVLLALAASALLVLAYGFYQYLFGISTVDMKWVDGDMFPELKKRVFSTWENPNILAGYLDMGICILLGIFARIRAKRARMLLLIGMLLMAACLTMTYARGACLTIAVIFICYGILKDRRVLIGCVLLAVLLLAVDSTLYARFANIFTQVDTSSEMRLAIWESTVAMIEDHPFFGIGWGAYWMVYPSYDFYLQGADVKLVHAHNIYLNYLAEIGVIGAAAFFWYFFGTMKMALGYKDPVMEEKRLQDKPAKEERYTFYEGLSFGIGLAMISVALNGLTDDLLFNQPTSMLLWMLAALAACIPKLSDR